LSLPLVKTWRIRLRCDRSAPRLARRALHWLRPVGTAADDLLLVATELVSNAVLDAGCDGEHEIELVAEVQPDTVRLRVIDADGRPPSRPRGASDLALGGVRLRVVQRLARRWGSEPGNRLRLWAELAL
jgi:anti-sigma regulatory factor (Ser/Thr protein kinase)